MEQSVAFFYLVGFLSLKQCRRLTVHSMLPSGDLTELLGSIPESLLSSSSTAVNTKDTTIPQLEMNDSHPFHICIVGGQETPSAGILHDWTRAISWTDMLEDWLCKGGGSPSVQRKDAESVRSMNIAKDEEEEEIQARDFGAAGVDGTDRASKRTSVGEEKEGEKMDKRASKDTVFTRSSMEVQHEEQKAQIGPYVLIAKERSASCRYFCNAMPDEYAG